MSFDAIFQIEKGHDIVVLAIVGKCELFVDLDNELLMYFN